MSRLVRNFFQVPSNSSDREWFETLLTGDRVRIERIISTGQTTPAGEWYDQETDEWVMLVQGEAELTYADGSVVKLTSGDYIFIPAGDRHRVTYTSSNLPCLWLAVHGNLTLETFSTS